MLLSATYTGHMLIEVMTQNIGDACWDLIAFIMSTISGVRYEKVIHRQLLHLYELATSLFGC
jgi:hypothetical protein